MRADLAVCVRCGYCCTKCSCGYGAYDRVQGRCVYLTAADAYGARHCRIYNEITTLEADDPFPMMGTGCSSSMFNGVREARINQMLKESQDAKMQSDGPVGENGPL